MAATHVRCAALGESRKIEASAMTWRVSLCGMNFSELLSKQGQRPAIYKVIQNALKGFDFLGALYPRPRKLRDVLLVTTPLRAANAALCA